MTANLTRGDNQQPVGAVFDPQTGYIVVNIDKIHYAYLDRPVRYRGIVFQPKQELHITIISQDAGMLLKRLENYPEDAAAIQDLVVSDSWEYRKLPEWYYVAEAPDKETIIQMVELPGLHAFLRELSKLVGQSMTIPPTHVTLYTRGTERGISIPDQAAFKDLVRASLQPEELMPIDDASTNPGVEQTIV